MEWPIDIKLTVINAKGAACVWRSVPSRCLELKKELNAKGYFPAYQARPDDCIHCAICCVMCPDVAISIVETADDTAAS